RFRVDRYRGRSADAGGYTLRITRYTPDYKDRDSSTASFPALEFELTKDGRTTAYTTLARYAGVVIPMKDGRPTQDDPNHLRAWYHPPDYRYGAGSRLRGLLQFAVGEGGRLYYRSFSSSNSDSGGFAFEKS